MRLAVDQLEATGSALVHRTGNNKKEKSKKVKRECSRVVIGRLEAYLVEAMNYRNAAYRGGFIRFRCGSHSLTCGDLMIASVSRYDEYGSEG